MQPDQTQPQSQARDHAERREWVRPVIARIDAGSAENDFSAGADLSDLS